MAQFGISVKHDSGGKRIEMQCEHQNGLAYVVRGEASWVCSDELLHAHALAGFFREVVELDDERINGIMQRWGIYYRTRPIADDSDAHTRAAANGE